MLSIALLYFLSAPAAWAVVPGESCLAGSEGVMCFIPNGNGMHDCKAEGNGTYSWSDCYINSCQIGYHVDTARLRCLADSGEQEPVPHPPLSEASDTSPAEAVAAQADEEFRRDSEAAAAASDGTQKKSLETSREVLTKGADRAATVAAIFCAEGTVAAKKQPERSAQDFAQCRSRFQSAASLNELAKRSGYESDPGVLGDQRAKSVLHDFEKSLGLTEGDGIAKLLGTAGARDALAGLLGSVVGFEKLAGLLEGAPKPAGEAAETSASAITAKGANARSAADKLRDRLRKDLTAGTPGTAPRKEKPIALGATQAGEFFPAPDEARERTLFEVVHARYEELARRQNLIWAR